MKISYFVLPLVFAFLFSGCASKDFAEPGEISVSRKRTGQVFPGSYTDVWNATLSALQDHKFPVANTQREGGVIITDWIRGKSDRLYSGYGDTRIPYNIRFRFTIQLRPSREGVSVQIENSEEYYANAVMSGSDFSGSLYEWIPTKSSTKKENGFLREIDSILSQGSTPSP